MGALQEAVIGQVLRSDTNDEMKFRVSYRGGGKEGNPP